MGGSSGSWHICEGDFLPTFLIFLHGPGFTFCVEEIPSTLQPCISLFPTHSTQHLGCQEVKICSSECLLAVVKFPHRPTPSGFSGKTALRAEGQDVEDRLAAVVNSLQRKEAWWSLGHVLVFGSVLFSPSNAGPAPRAEQGGAPEEARREEPMNSREVPG